ncbi:hypothetical protein MtrunA17_Chr8g0370541 [Medicago truncatula]|uniref:Uncharacterized protein n=1 Tax=Medicago truncatula TaxID=3880 RepID=G7L9E4_MEDTR|nr:hypothetical protein MTR_8g073710 [Medicago truncatula]RHN41861.1 hypothetical protein MtrunA17_Chr8g0370541 [Medicago truncatula]
MNLSNKPTKSKPVSTKTETCNTQTGFGDDERRNKTRVSKDGGSSGGAESSSRRTTSH